MHIHATLAEVIHHTDRQKPELATFSVLSRCLCCHLTSIHTPFPFTDSPPVNLQVTLRQAPPARLLILCAPVGARQKPVQPLPPVAFFSATELDRRILKYLLFTAGTHQSKHQHGNPASVTSHKFTSKWQVPTIGNKRSGKNILLPSDG